MIAIHGNTKFAVQRPSENSLRSPMMTLPSEVSFCLQIWWHGTVVGVNSVPPWIVSYLVNNVPPPPPPPLQIVAQRVSSCYITFRGMEDYEEIYDFLSYGTYPTGFSKNQKRALRRKCNDHFKVLCSCKQLLYFQLQNWLNAHCARSGFTSHACIWMKTLLCAIPYGTVQTVWHESWQLAIMLHIIIVLGGTVFTEGGHYSLANSVRAHIIIVLGGGTVFTEGGQNKGGGTKFTMTP